MYIFGKNFLYFHDFIQRINEININDENYQQAMSEFMQLASNLHDDIKLPNSPHNEILRRQQYKQYIDRFKHIYQLIQKSMLNYDQTKIRWCDRYLSPIQSAVSKLYFIRNVFYMHLYLIAKVLFLLLSKKADVKEKNRLQEEYPQIQTQAMPTQMPQIDYVQYSNIILTNMRLIHTINHIFEEAYVQLEQADTCYNPNYNKQHQMTVIEQIWDYMENIGLAMHDLIIQIYNIIELQNEKIGFHNIMLSMSIPQLTYFPEPWQTPHKSFRRFMLNINQFLNLIQISSLYKIHVGQDHDDDEIGEEQQTSDNETSVQNTSLSYHLMDTYYDDSIL